MNGTSLLRSPSNRRRTPRHPRNRLRYSRNRLRRNRRRILPPTLRRAILPLPHLTNRRRRSLQYRLGLVSEEPPAREE